MIKEDKELVKKIKELKKKRNAVILAHNYQLPEVQDIADFRGGFPGAFAHRRKDRCGCNRFCGVYFMAETASILSPDKKVIMPDTSASCPMANMMTAEDLRNLKEKYPQATAVGYVNTSAEVKAELDYCCTSTNAIAVINALADKKEDHFYPG